MLHAISEVIYCIYPVQKDLPVSVSQPTVSIAAKLRAGNLRKHLNNNENLYCLNLEAFLSTFQRLGTQIW